jgi:hypothetical protein
MNMNYLPIYDSAWIYEQFKADPALIARHLPGVSLGEEWGETVQPDGRIWARQAGAWVQVWHPLPDVDLNSPEAQLWLAVDPLPIDDDAIWEVRQWHEPERTGFAVTSDFTITFGPFGWQRNLDDWLDCYGLGLCVKDRYICFESYSAEMESGCFVDAVKRLHWIESIAVSINKEAELLVGSMWQEVDVASRNHIEKSSFDPSEILGPPVEVTPLPPKTRSANPELGLNFESYSESFPR